MTNRPPSPPRRLLPSCAAVVMAVSALTAVLTAGASPAAAAESAVGQVSLLIGEARVVRKGGAVETLRRGSSILVGDRVETAANGHVHVRFIDNAAVSVRPESVLEVQAYRYDAERPQNNEVRLHVEQGTSRSISGHATDADKNRFRLNTPVAAIGVRGTDFIVQTSDLGMRATVAEGAIVVGALGAGCSKAGLGPCAGAQTSVLSADMGKLMVEVNRGEQVARLVPASGALVAAAGTAEERVAAQRAVDSTTRTAALAAAQPFGTNDRKAAEVLTIAANVPARNSAPDASAQMVWGRYAFASFNDNVSDWRLHYLRPGREVVTGDGDYVLFRTASANGERVLTTNEANAKFNLTRGQATFDSAGKVEAASIDGGTLTLDFSRRTFATALALSSPTAGKAELRVAGDVRADGTFAPAPDNGQKVIGAVTLDGKEAGYLFERGVIGGLFRGKTLWGR